VPPTKRNDPLTRREHDQTPPPAAPTTPTQPNAMEVARLAMRQVAELTGRSPEGVTELTPVDGGWRVGVEVVEIRRVPATTDVLATYEAELNASGDLMSYRRTRRYSRAGRQAD
jgi:hypothetical protein